MIFLSIRQSYSYSFMGYFFFFSGFLLIFQFIHYYFKCALILDMNQGWAHFQGFDHVPIGFARWPPFSGSIRNIWRYVQFSVCLLILFSTWNHSIHLWCIRYIYLPLGGRSRQVLNVLIIFLFVGLWHNLLYLWIHWALVNWVCIILEAVVDRYTRNFPLWIKQIILSCKYMLIMIVNLCVVRDIKQILNFIVEICKSHNWFVIGYALFSFYLMAILADTKMNKQMQKKTILKS